MPSQLSKKEWPKNISDAIQILDLVIDDQEKDLIRKIALKDLNSLHIGLGTFIRNEFGLWKGNDSLITDTLEIDPDLASMTIIREFWDYLNKPMIPKFH